MADLIGALVAALAEDAGVAALASEDVFGAELPNDAVARLPANMIVVSASGGVSLTGGSDVAADAQRIDVTAYGTTPFEADELRRVAGRAMRRIRRQTFAGTLIHWVNSAGGFTAGRDRDGQWPQAMQSFQVFYAFEGEN